MLLIPLIWYSNKDEEGNQSNHHMSDISYEIKRITRLIENPLQYESIRHLVGWIHTHRTDHDHTKYDESEDSEEEWIVDRSFHTKRREEKEKKKPRKLGFRIPYGD